MAKTDDPERPKRVRKDRKAEILEEATRLFAEYGFQGATLARLAAAVQLTEPGVLHYFPSKVHLLQGVLEHRDRKDLDRYAHLIDTDKTLTEFFDLLQGVVREDEAVPGLIQLFTVLVGESIRSEHPSHGWFVDRYRRGRVEYAQQFVRMSPDETRKDVDFEDLASLIMAVRDGLQIQWLLDPDNARLAPTFELFARILVDYLRPPTLTGTQAGDDAPGATSD